LRRIILGQQIRLLILNLPAVVTQCVNLESFVLSISSFEYSSP